LDRNNQLSKHRFFDWLNDAEGFIQYYLDNKDRIQSRDGKDTIALQILDTIVHDLTGLIYEDDSMLPKCNGYGKYTHARSKRSDAN